MSLVPKAQAQANTAEVVRMDKVRKFYEDLAPTPTEHQNPKIVQLIEMTRNLGSTIILTVDDERLQNMAIDKLIEALTHAKRGL